MKSFFLKTIRIPFQLHLMALSVLAVLFISPIGHAFGTQLRPGVSDGGGSGALIAKCRFRDQGNADLTLLLTTSYSTMTHRGGINAALYQHIAAGSRILLFEKVHRPAVIIPRGELNLFENVEPRGSFHLVIHDRKNGLGEYEADLSQTSLIDQTMIGKAALFCQVPNP